jgi:ferric-dicitrate binding protein FerR (iron transport regulator)
LGPTDRVALRLAGGQSLRLDVATRLRLDSGSAITLECGAVYLDSRGGRENAVVRTALGEVREIGTQFEVRLAETVLSVRVREGSVLVKGVEEQIRIQSGTVGTFTPTLAPVLRPLSAWAEDWQWAQAIAPLLDIEGRSAAEFLAWVARESGVEVLYADAASERLAQEAILHGRLLGATPIATLDAVLPGCALRAAHSEGRLVISTVALAPVES